MGLKHLVGTPWHIERFTREEDDEKRHRSRCLYYRGHGYCAWHFERCWGSARCRHYSEVESSKGRNKVPKVTKEKAIERKIAAELESFRKSKEDKAKEKRVLQGEYTKEYPIGCLILHKDYGNGIVEDSTEGKILVKFDGGREIKLSLDACVNNHLIAKRDGV